MFPGLKLGGNGPLLEGNESANFQLVKQVFMALKYQITLIFFSPKHDNFRDPPVCGGLLHGGLGRTCWFISLKMIQTSFYGDPNEFSAKSV